MGRRRKMMRRTAQKSRLVSIMLESKL